MANSAGQIVAQADVTQGQSYAFAVPPGTYALTSPIGCVGTATVVAGQQSQGDVVCNVP